MAGKKQQPDTTNLTSSGYTLLHLFTSFVLGVCLAAVCVVVRRSWLPAPGLIHVDIPKTARRLYGAETYDVSAIVREGATEFHKKARGQAQKGSLPKHGTVTMAWQTPVYRVNIGGFFQEKKLLNDGLAEAVLDHYKRLASLNKERLSKLDATEANNIFFEWQTTNGGWALIAGQPEWQFLSGFFNSSIDMYLSLCGKDPEFISARSHATEQWATVHKDHMNHDAHTHPGSIVSGVYYVQMPPDAGRLVFDDPRGNGRSPFDTQMAIEPEPGDLVLFPSWLLHKVTPTVGSAERISIAFNVPGRWEDLTDSRQDKDVNVPSGAQPQLPANNQAGGHNEI